MKLIHQNENRPGYKETKIGWIPKRWEFVEFQKIAQLSKTKYDPKSNKRNYKCIELEHIEQNNGTINGSINSNSQKSVKNIFDIGQVLFGKLRPYLRKFYLCDFSGVCSTEIWVLDSSEKCNALFLFQLIQTEKFIKVANVSSGTKMPRSDWNYVSKFPFLLPPLSEQKKIAAILSTWDKAIEKIDALIKAKEQQKKGLMQKLLTGKVRFPGFTEPWKEVRLGDVTEYFDGTHMTPNYVASGIPFYTVENITNDDFYNTKFISEVVFNEENKRVRLEKGDILMTRIGDIGTPKLLDWNVTASFYVSLCLIKKQQGLNSKYLSYYINSNSFQKELWKRTIHVAFPKKINLGEIGNCFVALPTIKEQQKIASILSDCDKEIELLKKEKTAMEQLKKGLMQKLLTGSVRVRV